MKVLQARAVMAWISVAFATAAVEVGGRWMSLLVGVSVSFGLFAIFEAIDNNRGPRS